MKAFRIAAWLLLAGLLLSVALVAAWAAWGEPLSHAVVDIDGDQINLARLHGGHWLLAIVGVFIALGLATIVVLLVVPVAVLMPLLIAAMVCAVALAVVAGVAALLLSPLIFLVWVLWRLARDRGPAPAITP